MRRSTIRTSESSLHARLIKHALLPLLFAAPALAASQGEPARCAEPVRAAADGCIDKAVVSAAGNTGRPSTVRLAALQVLAAFYDPKFDALAEWLRTAHAGDPIPMSVHGGGRLRQSVAFRDSANTPVQPGSVSLTAGCGNRVTLSSTENILLGLQLSVLGAWPVHTVWLKGSPEGKPVTILMSPPPGTVVVTYGGRELARLSERHAPCPPGLVIP